MNPRPAATAPPTSIPSNYTQNMVHQPSNTNATAAYSNSQGAIPRSTDTNSSRAQMRSLENIVLPPWSSDEIDKRLNDSETFLKEWNDLIASTGI